MLIYFLSYDYLLMPLMFSFLIDFRFISDCFHIFFFAAMLHCFLLLLQCSMFISLFFDADAGFDAMMFTLHYILFTFSFCRYNNVASLRCRFRCCRYCCQRCCRFADADFRLLFMFLIFDAH